MDKPRTIYHIWKMKNEAKASLYKSLRIIFQCLHYPSPLEKPYLSYPVSHTITKSTVNNKYTFDCFLICKTEITLATFQVHYYYKTKYPIQQALIQLYLPHRLFSQVTEMPPSHIHPFFFLCPQYRACFLHSWQRRGRRGDSPYFSISIISMLEGPTHHVNI